MQIIKQQEVNIDELTKALKQGKVIVYPTETCYGLGCDATNTEAVDKLFKIKKRQERKPVLVLAADADIIKKYINWTPVLGSLAEKYWPGPLTVVAKMREGIDLPSGVMGKDRTLAFRITDYPFASALCRELGRPLVSTSANISGMESPYDIAGVLNMFSDAADQPDIVIDGGTLARRSPSTIVSVVDDKIKILRQGELSLDV